MAKAQERIDKAVELIYLYSGIDGDHHKQWVFDQVLKSLLTKKGYREFVEAYEGEPDEEGDTEYSWDTGIAP